MVGATYYGTKTLSAVRAYVTGEGLWTKAQKEATHQLLRYSISEDSTHYKQFQQALDLPYGFSKARKTMISENPSYELAREGFSESQLTVRDINLLYWLGSNFHEVPYFHDAFVIWAQGEQKISELDSLATVIRQAVATGELSMDQKQRFQQKISTIDREITDLENRFTMTMATGSEWVRGFIFWVIIGGGILLIGGSYVLTDRYFKQINDLNDQLERLSLVASKTTDVVIITDAEQRIRWVNDTFESKLGYTKEEVMGRVPGNFLQGPGTSSETLEELAQAIKNEESVRATVLNYTKDGQEIWLDLKIDPIFNEEGQLELFIAIERDVTEQIRREADIRQSLKRYNIVAQATSDTIWDLDLKNNMIHYNDVVYEMFGYARSEIENVHSWWQDKIHPNDREQVMQELDKAISSGEDRFQLEYRFKCADGSYKHIYDRAYIVKDEEGDPVQIIGAMQDITQRKEVLKDEEQNRRLLEAITENTETPVWVRESDGTIVLANTEWKKLFDIEDEEVVGKSIYDLVDEDTAETFRQNDERVITSQETRTFFETVYIGGKKHHFVTSMFPLLNVPGLDRATGGVAIDITARRQAEKDLKRSEKRLQTLFSNLPGMAYRCENKPGWPMKFLSEQCADITGYDASEFTEGDGSSQKVYGKLILEEDKDRVWNEVQRAVENNDAFEVTYRIRNKEGEVRWVRESGVGVRYDQTGDVLLEGFIMDITNRKKAEQKLVKTEQRMREIVENSTNMFYRHTADHVLTYVSPQSREYLGCEPEEAMTRWTEFVTENPVNEEGLKITQKAIDTGEVQDPFELELQKADGEKIWVEVNEAPITENGQTVAIVGSLTDITERKNVEREISHALKEKETLLAEVHHRVKNNMAVVSGMMQLQAFKEDKPEIKAKLLDNVARIGTMASIHEHLYQSENFSTLKFSENLQSLSKKLVNTMQVDTAVTIETDLEMVELNLNQAIPCSLIVSEVITNALKHAFDGREQGKLTLELQQVDNTFRLEISDNGVGIPEHYSKGDTESSLGIHLIQKLSNQLKGEYDYRSTGEGTVFTLEFEKAEVKGSGSAHITNSDLTN
ncbi:MAG: PAS domain S-box protein [Fodinibius sp.]|nr:PAS domain S-box protein [Fodinibius sp.]